MININLKNLTTDELESLEKEIKQELNLRNCSHKKVIYEHSCKNSAKYHLGKYKHWSKLLAQVDDSKTNGFAFIGDFLSVDKQNSVPFKSFIIEFSGCANNCFCLLQMVNDNEYNVLHKGKSSEMIDFIKKVKEITML